MTRGLQKHSVKGKERDFITIHLLNIWICGEDYHIYTRLFSSSTDGRFSCRLVIAKITDDPLKREQARYKEPYQLRSISNMIYADMTTGCGISIPDVS